MRRTGAPAWARLSGHSYRLGAAWAARGLRRLRWPAARAGLMRLLVPLEPWRFYELGRVAREPFGGDCLDLGSPKLLASALQAGGRGRWVAVDLLEEEIDRWRVLDPALDLRVADGRALPFADASFDAVACVSVIEHVPGDGDARAMEEIWRVLRPEGVLHLTTNLAARPRELHSATPRYGEASPRGARGAFFERHYSEETLAARLLALPWREEAREYVAERLPVHRLFFAARPWSFALGGLLPLACVANFRRIGRVAVLREGEHAVAYLRLRRPA